MDLRLVLAVGSLLLAGCATPERSAGEIGTADLADFGVNGDPFLGNPDAAIQVVAYEAPACSNCAYYHAANFPAIEKDFIETGKIGYHFVQYTIGYSYDIPAGIAEECAYREGGVDAYLAMVNRVFQNQTKPTQLSASLSGIASQFDLDDAVLQSCLDNEETRDEVESDLAAGKSSGAGYNPGFAVIKGDQVKLVRGASGPYSAIEALL